MTAALGLTGTFGFFWLVGRMFLRRPRDCNDVADVLALLTVAAVLLATVGGLGSVLAYLASPGCAATTASAFTSASSP